MGPTRSEKWALAARRQAKAPVAVDLVLCGIAFFSPTIWFVGRFLEGRLAVLDFVFLELLLVLFAGVFALWMFERRCFVRLLDAKDREIRQLKGQRDPA